MDRKRKRGEKIVVYERERERERREKVRWKYTMQAFPQIQIEIYAFPVNGWELLCECKVTSINVNV